MKKIGTSLSESYARTILRGGEILVNVRGTLGGVAVAAPDMSSWNVSREVAVVPVDPRRIDPKFVCYHVGARSSHEWRGGVKKGAAYVGINIEDLRRLPIKAPPKNHQRDVVKHLDQVSQDDRRLKSLFKRKLAALTGLKQSLLQKAFAGELTTGNADRELAEAGA